jgi:hypothetical protein
VNTITSDDWGRFFASFRAGKWKSNLSQQLQMNTLENITSAQIIAWIAAKETQYGLRIGCMPSYSKPFHAMSDYGCEFGDTPEEAVNAVKENLEAKAAERIKTLREKADDLLKQADALEAGK